jgi:UDP-N-acetylglucosamine 2-epimerase
MDDIELSIASRYLYQNLPQIEASDIHQRLGLEKGKYILLSAHREENIDTEKNFMSRFTAINRMAENRRTSESNAKRLAA